MNQTFCPNYLMQKKLISKIIQLKNICDIKLHNYFTLRGFNILIIEGMLLKKR